MATGEVHGATQHPAPTVAPEPTAAQSNDASVQTGDSSKDAARYAFCMHGNLQSEALAAA